MIRLAGLTGYAALLASTTAMAADYGAFSADFTFELQHDSLYDSSNPANEIDDTYATIEAALAFALSEDASLNAVLVYEPVIDATSDRTFEDHGLYVQELYYAHDFGPAQMMLGKFNPAFGMAWDEAPGLYGTDFAGDYEITEQLGASITVPFAIGASENELTFAVFNADRSILSDSLGKERGQTSLPAGGVTNTTGPESFVLSVGGSWGEMGYNVSLQNLAKGVGDVADQTGVSLGVTHTYDLGLPVSMLAEVAYFDDFGGTFNSARYSTIGLSAPVGPVTLSGVYSVRQMQGASSDELATVSAEMELMPGLTGALGYRYGDEGGDKNRTVGMLLAYEF
ncbi:hypothetical protein O4H61_05285 [Roseovarius aestuarii]|nr:hypothetical protein [Roseovarius aestuarii]